MSIIEKLGITPGPWEISFNNSIKGVFDGRNGDDGWYNGPDDCDIKIIAAAPEMLEALIEWGIYAERFSFTDINSNNPFKIIEKATGKTWEEIKELIDE